MEPSGARFTRRVLFTLLSLAAIQLTLLASAGQAKVSGRPPAATPYEPTRGVVVAGSATAGSIPAGSSPRRAISGPITITRGGTYSGTWSSAGTAPAVRVSTTEPVRITNSLVQNVNGGELVRAGAGANVTITYTKFQGGNGRAFYAYGIGSLTIANCTIDETSGIRLDSSQVGATISVTRNKARDIQAASYNTQFVQLANVTAARADISWNEVVNTFGRSGVEDNISLYATAYAKVHDNYIQGAYPSSASATFSGSGIMIDQRGSHDNDVYSNQVVATTNAGIAIAGGWNNKVHDNRIVFDGRLEDGTILRAANVGLYVWNGVYHDPGWANNDAYGNTVGWVNGAGKRNDWWNPDCTGSCSNVAVAGALDNTSEQAEYRAWLAKTATSGVAVGV